MRPHLGPRRVSAVRVPADIDVDALAERDGYTVKSTWLADLVAVNTGNHSHASGPPPQPLSTEPAGLPAAVSLPTADFSPKPATSPSAHAPMVRHTMRLTTAIDATAHAHRAGYRSVSRWVSDLVVVTAGRHDLIQGPDLDVAPDCSMEGLPLRTIA